MVGIFTGLGWGVGGGWVVLRGVVNVGMVGYIRGRLGVGVGVSVVLEAG